MKKLAITTLFCAVAGASSACDEPNFGSKFSDTIPSKPDQKLFTQALLLATNYERCKVGKASLGTHATLRKAALIHSRNMAKTKVFSHNSRADNARTVKARAKLVNLKWRWLAENIALQNRYRFGNRVPFRIVDQAACKFKNSKTGKPIAAHTYASLAQDVTKSWMASKGHRQNIHSRYAGRMAAALVFDETAPNCGKIYITQVFSN
jgi:uncharacterized protein YkwD